MKTKQSFAVRAERPKRESDLPYRIMGCFAYTYEEAARIGKDHFPDYLDIYVCKPMFPEDEEDDDEHS